jgi:hypothetical protein
VVADQYPEVPAMTAHPDRVTRPGVVAVLESAARIAPRRDAAEVRTVTE